MKFKNSKNDHPLAGFFIHGVNRGGFENGNEYIGNCPFCSRENKFYINRATLLWDCKVCGEHGNYLSFLKNVSAYNYKYIKDNHIFNLAEDRNLPIEAFQGWKIGFDGAKYTIPIFNYEGTFCGIKNFFMNFVKNRMQNQKGLKPQLFGADRLAKNEDGTIYICEGEWDAIAMNWLINRLNKNAVAVAVPSANTFSDTWREWFYRREVICMYDNDAAGKKGEEKIFSYLKDVCTSLNFVHWDVHRPEGFDTKDMISEVAFRGGRPNRCWKEIHKTVHPTPRNLLSLTSTNEDNKLEINPKYQEKLDPISFSELVKVFKSYLYLPDITPIKVVLASIFANRLDGEMIWMFLVAPPSSAKTEFIQALDTLKSTVPISRFTTKTLSSGFMQTAGKKDTSLLPILNGKIAVVKDFTGVLTMHPKDQDDIFGQLRDAYDGKTDYYYGHGQNKHHTSKFGLIAGVTEVIERVNSSGSLHTALGERFLRYRFPKDLLRMEDIGNSDLMHKMDRAMHNTGKETKKREVLMHAIKRFFEAEQKEFIAEMPEHLARRLKYIAWFTARLRGFVDRDKEGNVNYTPGSESPIRLVKQLYRLAVGLARVENKRHVDEEDFRVIKKIALDTCPSRIELFVRTLYEKNGPLQYQEISQISDFDPPTVNAVLRDLLMLKVVDARKIGGRTFYVLSKLSKELIAKGGIYPPLLKKKKFIL